jgi:histidyl-tRNA synthetase
MELKPPRGTEDLLPPRSEAMLALYDAAARAARLYGYTYVESPSFEATEVFARTSGESSDIVRKEMYTFEDRGGRLLTLRPEGTAGMVRAYLAKTHELPSPFKAYTIGHMWRYGRPQSGRLREFRQFDIEIIGSAEPGADIEVIEAGDRYLRGLGIQGLTLELNSIGDEVCRPAYRRELIEYLEANRERLRDEHRERFRENPMRVLDCKDEACREVAVAAPKIADRLCEACRAHFDMVRKGLADRDIDFTLVPTLVRGLDYYTRTTFEWVSPMLSEGQASVGGGGRYDGLAEVLGGPATPGVGWAIGLDRILIALAQEGGKLPGQSRLECFVVSFGEAAVEMGGRLARSLREAGISTDAPLERRPLGAQLKMADRSGATFALIVGEREAAAGTVTFKRLADGQQEEVPADGAIAWIRSHLPEPSP